MKKVQYKDEEGKLITKKEGFSWPTFWLLFFFTFGIGAVIYTMSKGGFMAIRGAIRAGKKTGKADKDQK